jgi:alkyl sulfatase BDS1-like metallo-beta-lactamase superfamily hydrolase
MSRIRELGEELWAGNVRAGDYHPFAPLLELEEVADGVAFVSGFGNIAAIRTGEGLVLVDTGNYVLAGQIHRIVRGWDAAPVHTAIFTHGHIDHVFGLPPFEHEAEEKGWKPPVVVAHEAVPARFDRYRLTRGYNSCINSRQFQMPIKFPERFPYPHVTYDRETTVTVGGAELSVRHARGETDDHSWVWFAERKVLFTGDLFLWVFPNAGNPQKVQRYPREWAAALRAMDALGAEVLCPGHGVPIFGAARVRQALTDTASALESLVEQTLALMNAGARLDETLRSVRIPEHLTHRPYLQPIYDEPEFVVRNIWRLYGGWYDNNPAHLKPAPEVALAKELSSLSGGAGKLADRAAALAAQGELALACHLAELAGQASPDDPAIWKIRSQVYGARAQKERSLMARGIYQAAADEPTRAAGTKQDG